MEIRKNNSKGYFACFAAAVFSFFNLFQLSIMNSVAPAMATSFHLSSVSLGLLSSSYVWANALGLIPIGILIDRYSPRPLALIFITLSTIACFIITFSHSWKLVLIMRFVQGITSAASFLTCMRMAIRWFDKRANTAIGLMVGIALLGGVTGNDIFSKVVSNFGWRNGFLVSGILGLVVLILVFCFLFEKKSNSQNNSIFKVNAIPVLKNSRNLLLGTYLGLMSLPLFIFAAVWGNLYLQEIYGMTQIKAGFTTSFLFLGLMCGSPLVGIIADHLKNPALIMKTGAALSLVGIIPFIFQWPLSSSALMLLFFLLGVIGSTQNVVFVLIAQTNPSGILSTITAVASFVENLIGASGQLLFGWLLHLSWQRMNVNHFSVTLAHHYMTATLLFPIAFVFSFIIVFLCSSASKLEKL